MIETFKGRELTAGQEVKVYFNLHTHLFSVKDKKSGQVVAHGNNIIVEGVTFKVSEAGRQRVLREGRKNVHAYVIGKYVGTADDMSVPLQSAYYNPRTVKTFIDADGKELHTAQMAYLSNKKVNYL